MSACGQSVPFELFQCVVPQNSAGPNGKQYDEEIDEEIRKFAITLHFYSPRAYDYPSVIRSWYHVLNGEPGFTQESFNILKLHAKCATQKGDRVIL